MITYIYNVIFVYIAFLFFKEHSAIVVYHKGGPNKKVLRRYGDIRLFKRFSHLKFRHPVPIKPMMT